MKIKKNGVSINLTESDLKRIVKKVLKEQTDIEGSLSGALSAGAVGASKEIGNWSDVYDGLKNFESPKIINFKDQEGNEITSLNWGSHKSKTNDGWGVSIGSDRLTNITFTTEKKNLSDVFHTVTGIEPDYNDLSGTYSTLFNTLLEGKNSDEIVKLVKKLINDLNDGGLEGYY